MSPWDILAYIAGALVGCALGLCINQWAKRVRERELARREERERLKKEEDAALNAGIDAWLASRTLDITVFLDGAIRHYKTDYTKPLTAEVVWAALNEVPEEAVAISVGGNFAHGDDDELLLHYLLRDVKGATA